MAPERVADLVAALSDPDRTADAALALARLARSDPAAVEPAVPVLLPHLDAPEPTVRHRVAQALAGAAAGGVAVPVAPLRDALRDDHDAVRQNAARALAGLATSHPDELTGERALVGPLFADPDARVREFAGRTVGHLAASEDAWREPPPELAREAARRWRVAAALALVRERLTTLATECDGERASEDVERLCRGVERAVLRGRDV